jgi:glycosyltransferase involved in cell wall biosynthesis
MSDLFVSIVVPTYDRAGYVEAAIMSLLDQDYERLEVIALDDGSHDETPSILERIATRTDSERFRWLRHENIGQAATINRGLEETRGDLLGYLSSDDYFLPGGVARLAAAAEAHPDGEVFYPGYVIVDDADRVLDTVTPVQHTFVDALRWALCIPGAGALMRRRCYERSGGWDARYHFCPDYVWWLNAGSAPFVRVPGVAAAWRSHDGSTTLRDIDVNNVKSRLAERFILLDEIFARDDLPPEVRAIEPQAYSSTLIEMGALMDRGGVGGPERRFGLDDRLGPRYSEAAGRGAVQDRLWYLRHSKLTEQRANALAVINTELEKTIAALEKAGRNDELHLAALEAQLADAQAQRDAVTLTQAQTTRPPWLRIARKLTPPPLRDRAGAALHRARRITSS